MIATDAPDYRTPSAFVTFRLSRLQSSLNAQAAAILKAQAGLSLVEWRIIQVLRMFENASLTKIAGIVEMDKGQLSRKITAMVEKGLLSVEQDAQDQRVQHLHLTAAAKDLSQRVMPTMAARQNRLLAEICPRDLEAFYRVVEKLEAASKVRETE